ncbi:hypothetical protein, partial [Sulfurimonas sp.]|uniref:hypothetical protein n=1 Tax=Sulfurimonas sp. TaxID=2022749 RepID=UPI003D0C7705
VVQVHFLCLVAIQSFLMWIVAAGSWPYLKLLDQKTQCFLFLITLKRLLLKHARKVFDEMPVRT